MVLNAHSGGCSNSRPSLDLAPTRGARLCGADAEVRVSAYSDVARVDKPLPEGLGPLAPIVPSVRHRCLQGSLRRRASTDDRVQRDQRRRRLAAARLRRHRPLGTRRSASKPGSDTNAASISALLQAGLRRSDRSTPGRCASQPGGWGAGRDRSPRGKRHARFVRRRGRAAKAPEPLSNSWPQLITSAASTGRRPSAAMQPGRASRDPHCAACRPEDLPAERNVGQLEQRHREAIADNARDPAAPTIELRGSMPRRRTAGRSLRSPCRPGHGSLPDRSAAALVGVVRDDHATRSACRAGVRIFGVDGMRSRSIFMAAKAAATVQS